MLDISTLIDFILHIDTHIAQLIQNYGSLTYIILFAIIFVETGFVIMPFLPGDSLLFVAGAFAALDSLNVFLLSFILILAAILGDTLNYWIGHHIGKRALQKNDAKFFKREYLITTQKFYELHGAKTIVLARFIPIIRTFAPFVAGIGHMRYTTFLIYNILGGIAWVLFFVLIGYFFGNIPLVQENFSLFVILIILLSIILGVVEYARVKKSQHL